MIADYQNIVNHDDIQLANHFDWTRHLIYANAVFGFADSGPNGQAPCLGCAENTRQPTERAKVSVPKERLTVANSIARRGLKNRSAHSFGRKEHYPCLAQMFRLKFHPEFAIVFHTFASLIHFSEKVHHHKASFLMSTNGPTTAASLFAPSDL